jgi:TPP-dependent 2-oxoacid decarboxylase
MKKYLAIVILFVSFSINAQSLADKFDVKEYAKQQTEMIKSALDLSDAMVEGLYKANLSKAYSIQKHIILFEQEGKTDGKTLKQVIKDVNVMAEKASGYEDALHHALGADKFDEYMDKFGK